MKTNPVFGYRIFPPYIDAYRTSYRGLVSIDDIKNQMIDHAYEWGGRVVGESILLRRNIPKHGNKIVLCCANIYLNDNDDDHKQYLVVIDENQFGNDWMDNLEFVEGNFNDEWNVT